MPDLHSLLERADRAVSRVPMPEVDIESIRRRRDRRHRDQRLTAGLVGISVFAAALSILFGLGSADHTERDPAGTVPSQPEEVEVVARYFEPDSGGPSPYSAPQFLYVYADGRVLAWGWGSDYVTERRLTPEGVELVRSREIQAADLTPSSTGVPADVWEDPAIEPYVPLYYAVCYTMDVPDGAPQTQQGNDGYEYPSRVVGFFPPAARAILRGELTHGTAGDPDAPTPECSRVTTAEADALVDILRDVRVADSGGMGIIWELQMILPHGVMLGYCSPGSCG
jgi:hypothetical protein